MFLCPMCGYAHKGLTDAQNVRPFGESTVVDCGSCGWDFTIHAMYAPTVVGLDSCLDEGRGAMEVFDDHGYVVAYVAREGK